MLSGSHRVDACTVAQSKSANTQNVSYKLCTNLLVHLISKCASGVLKLVSTVRSVMMLSEWPCVLCLAKFFVV